MRVISGTAKGRRLKSFRGRALRPTADRVKEALFNILPHDLSGLRVLDLFGGTGNLSLEALSRGARNACIVDQSQRAVRMIRSNLKTFDFAPSSKVLVVPVLRAIGLLAGKGSKFDLIFVDPPYGKGWMDRVLGAIAREGLLEEKGILVIEHSVREKVQEQYNTLELYDQRRYGDTLLSFFGCVVTGRLLKEKRKTWHAQA